MVKNIIKKYIILSGLGLRDNNRGTAALGYGAFSFLYDKHLITKNPQLVKFLFVKNFFKAGKEDCECIQVQGLNVTVTTIYASILEWYMLSILGKVLPFTKFGKVVKQVEFVAAINGGDGFSDIYGTGSFIHRLYDTRIAMKLNIPVYLLPQTIGPFKDDYNKKIATDILRYAFKIYIRDDKYISELNRIGVTYKMSKDLSYYMKPEPFDINIKNNSVGINISGLAYFNQYKSLSGNFLNYPYLIIKIINSIRRYNVSVYLIPHSYNYTKPDINNDDIVACLDVYNQIKDKSNIYLIDQDLISPQIKYVISKMTYFIGTRMHANFAAIYTGVPLYGLAYSYKFEGAFKANKAYDNNVSLINNITREDCDFVIDKILNHYERTHQY